MTGKLSAAFLPISFNPDIIEARLTGAPDYSWKTVTGATNPRYLAQLCTLLVTARLECLAEMAGVIKLRPKTSIFLDVIRD